MTASPGNMTATPGNMTATPGNMTASLGTKVLIGCFILVAFFGLILLYKCGILKKLWEFFPCNKKAAQQISVSYTACATNNSEII